MCICKYSISIAKNSGFCFGVKRAIKITLEAAEQYKKIQTIGPLIHNPQMVEKLKANGVNYVSSIDNVKSDSTVIIRSHGITKGAYKDLSDKKVKIIDATCPYVAKTQQFCKELSENGFQVVILGDRNHPEVVALESFVKSKAIIVSSAEELPHANYKKLGIISQTTQTFDKFSDLANKAIAMAKEVHVVNTICNATDIRQQCTLKLAEKSDIMIVIGGKNSSNTKMLAKISSSVVCTHHIETSDELDMKWFEGNHKIGITAGASTPDWIILDIYNKIIERLCGRNLQVADIEEIPGYKEE